ncbi:MAG: S4 domain-containing protein YaaA [Bacilli bacterium]
MEKLIIKTDYILLGQFLKYAGIISNGGQSKMFLAENSVKINGIIDQRRGKKLFPGDIVEVLGQKYEILMN